MSALKAIGTIIANTKITTITVEIIFFTLGSLILNMSHSPLYSNNIAWNFFFSRNCSVPSQLRASALGSSMLRNNMVDHPGGLTSAQGIYLHSYVYSMTFY